MNGRTRTTIRARRSKIQAGRIAVLPYRLERIAMTPKHTAESEAGSDGGMTEFASGCAWRQLLVMRQRYS